MRATRGRILRVKLGVNPNSSSLGTDIVFLALAPPLAACLLLTISALLRTLLRRKTDVQEEHLHP
jgi:hypothetical protein